MADSKPYKFQLRWWRRFSNVIVDNPQALKDLQDAHSSNKNHYFDPYMAFFSLHNIPTECIDAVKLYLSSPNLSEEEYAKIVKPPLEIIDFWNSKWHRLKRGENSAETMQEFKGLLMADGYTSLDTYTGHGISSAFLKQFGRSLLIKIEPGTTITELREIIDELWPAIERELIGRDPNTSPNKPYQKRVDKPPSSKQQEAKKIMIKMRAQGHKYSEITKYLDDNGFGWYDEPNIRKLVSLVKKRED